MLDHNGRCALDCSQHAEDVPKPAELIESLRAMTSDELHHFADSVRQVQVERALDHGDHDAIIADAFEIGFANDGLGVQPRVRSNTWCRTRFVEVSSSR